MLDASDVIEFAERLQPHHVEQVAQSWASHHGDRTAALLTREAPVGPGDPVHLRDEIRQVEPGGITFGRAYWWRFVEYGTTRMAPRPFVQPTLKRVKPAALEDAWNRVRRSLTV